MNVKLTTLVVVFAFFGLPASSFGDPQPASEPGGGWMLQSEFSDEFNGDTLDTNKWDNDVKDWGEWSWEPYNVYGEDGTLHLIMQYEEHTRWPGGPTLYYTSGIIRSKDPDGIKYGYFEARIKAAPRHPGVSSAFWASRAEWDPDRNYWGLWTEIDFTEMTWNRNLVSTSRHIHDHPDYPEDNPEDKLVWESRTAYVPFDPRDDFHIYGCEWNENEIKWYIDGELVDTRKNTMWPPKDDPSNPNFGLWHYPLDVTVSIGLRQPLKDNPSSEGFPTVCQVDYVRVWKPILPVTIDIKPGSYPNAVNLGSHGLIPVAIFSSNDFNATTVDPDTVELAGSGVEVRGKSNKYMSHQEDVNGDGLVDLMLQVATANLDPESLQSGEAILTGLTYDGKDIQGTDDVTIVP